MKKALIFLMCSLSIVAATGCGPDLESLNIQANESVNIAWGGYMCEADGLVYYVSRNGEKEKIMSMKSDGSHPAAVTANEYDDIRELTADGDYLYFAASSEADDEDTIYRLPLSGGIERKIAEGHTFSLQYANGKLYWEDYCQPLGIITSDQTTSIQIKCVNPDGSDIKTLYSPQAPGGVAFEFLATQDGLYCVAESPGDDHSDIYRMDPDGKNTVKLNNSELGIVDKLFYDEGQLYFLMEHFDNGLFWDSFETMDDKGEAKTIVREVGYYPQDYSDIEYCGISGHMLYYFILCSNGGSSKHLPMDLHQFDLGSKRDAVLLRNAEMGDPAVGVISSLQGKNIPNDGVFGLYILGDDIYFSPYAMP